MGEKKNELIIIRIEKKLKDDFILINKEKNIKSSQKIRQWIREYVKNNKIK